MSYQQNWVYKMFNSKIRMMLGWVNPSWWQLAWTVGINSYMRPASAGRGISHGARLLAYPLVMTNIAIEHGPFIVDLPSDSMVIFHSYVRLPQGILKWLPHLHAGRKRRVAFSTIGLCHQHYLFGCVHGRESCHAEEQQIMSEICVCWIGSPKTQIIHS